MMTKPSSITQSCYHNTITHLTGKLYYFQNKTTSLIHNALHVDTTQHALHHRPATRLFVSMFPPVVVFILLLFIWRLWWHRRTWLHDAVLSWRVSLCVGACVMSTRHVAWHRYVVERCGREPDVFLYQRRSLICLRSCLLLWLCDGSHHLVHEGRTKVKAQRCLQHTPGVTTAQQRSRLSLTCWRNTQ